jgi:hypothetical protein
MQLETKFMRVPLAATVGSRFGDWQVTWIGGWDKWRLYYLVMVVKLPRQAYEESPAQTPSAGARPRHGPVPGHLRLVIGSVCGPPNLATSTCTRTLGPDGALTEVVHLDGSRDGLTSEDLERFIGSFPIERGEK